MTDVQHHSLTKRILEGYKSREDVTFLVGKEGQQEEAKAVVFILRISSPVFDTMFNSTWNGQKEVIRILDIEPHVFRNFLKLLVTDDLNKSHFKALNMTIWDTLQLLETARKYEVTFIHSTCQDFLIAHMAMDVTNAPLIYEWARVYGEIELEDKAVIFISREADKVFRCDDDFLNLSRESLSRLLKSNDLVIPELDLFNHVCRWGRAQCVKEHLIMTTENIRKVLGDLLFLIRFPLISPSDMVKRIKPAGILSTNEYVGLLERIVLPVSERGKSSPFGDTPRSWQPVELKL